MRFGQFDFFHVGDSNRKEHCFPVFSSFRPVAVVSGCRFRFSHGALLGHREEALPADNDVVHDVQFHHAGEFDERVGCLDVIYGLARLVSGVRVGQDDAGGVVADGWSKHLDGRKGHVVSSTDVDQVHIEDGWRWQFAIERDHEKVLLHLCGIGAQDAGDVGVGGVLAFWRRRRGSAQEFGEQVDLGTCLLYTSPSPRD